MEYYKHSTYGVLLIKYLLLIRMDHNQLEVWIPFSQPTNPVRNSVRLVNDLVLVGSAVRGTSLVTIQTLPNISLLYHMILLKT